MAEMKIVYMDPKKLKPYEKNPRYNENSVKPVMESIKAYGFKVPIVVDKDMVIITGHTRQKAALELGLEKVPVIVADDLNEDQIRAFRIADNKVADFSIWDNKLLLAELEDLADLDVFTGFDFSDMGDFEILDEKENDAVDENEDGVTYEVVLRSMNKDKVEKIQKVWEEMGGDD